MLAGCLHEGGDDVCGGPAEDKAGLLRFARLGHVLDVTGCQPQLAHPHGLLQLEVAPASGFRDEQQVGEQEEVSFLRLDALRIEMQRVFKLFGRVPGE